MEKQVLEEMVEGLQEEKPSVEKELKEFRFGSMLSLEEIRSAQMEFVRQRNWEHFHAPRNLMLALAGEVGELAELFQWRKDADCNVGLPGWSEEDKERVGQELSDVLIYLVDLAATCHIDLSKAVVKKMVMNEVKYPSSHSLKYKKP